MQRQLTFGKKIGAPRFSTTGRRRSPKGSATPTAPSPYASTLTYFRECRGTPPTASTSALLRSQRTTLAYSFLKVGELRSAFQTGSGAILREYVHQHNLPLPSLCVHALLWWNRVNTPVRQIATKRGAFGLQWNPPSVWSYGSSFSRSAGVASSRENGTDLPQMGGRPAVSEDYHL